MHRFIEGTTSSGRKFKRLELIERDEIYCVHAALTYEYGEDSHVVQIIGKRLAKLAMGQDYHSPLVLRDRHAIDAYAGMEEMAADYHDGFSELADVAIGDPYAASDYSHMPGQRLEKSSLVAV